MDVAVFNRLFMEWFDLNKDKGDWVKGANSQKETLLYIALQNEKTSPAVMLALMTACPESVKKINNKGNTALYVAVENGRSNAEVQQIISHYPGALEVSTPVNTSAWRMSGANLWIFTSLKVHPLQRKP